MVVRGKFGQRKPVGPIILEIGDVGTEISLEDCIKAFRLTVGLGMVRR